jgi:hypothetical protein
MGSFEEKNETTKLFLPNGFESGVYLFYVKVTHPSYSAESHRTIEVQVKDGVANINFTDTNKNPFKIPTPLIIAIIIAFVLLLVKPKIRRLNVKMPESKKEVPQTLSVEKPTSKKSENVYQDMTKFVNIVSKEMKKLTKPKSDKRKTSKKQSKPSPNEIIEKLIKGPKAVKNQKQKSRKSKSAKIEKTKPKKVKTKEELDEILDNLKDEEKSEKI